MSARTGPRDLSFGLGEEEVGEGSSPAARWDSLFYRPLFDLHDLTRTSLGGPIWLTQQSEYWIPRSGGLLKKTRHAPPHTPALGLSATPSPSLGPRNLPGRFAQPFSIVAHSSLLMDIAFFPSRFSPHGFSISNFPTNAHSHLPTPALTQAAPSPTPFLLQEMPAFAPLNPTVHTIRCLFP